MFVAIKDDKIIAHNETGEFPCLVCDEIKEIDDVTLVEVIDEKSSLPEGEYLPDTDEKAIEFQKAKKSNQVRRIRNQYLEETDKYMILDYPISDDERLSYKNYREYLRDYTENDQWWESNPLVYEDWKATI